METALTREDRTEDLTGLDFLTSLAGNVEEAVEGAVAGNVW